MPPKNSGPDFSHETALIAMGYSRVAGVDEAGRGPLAGPVVAAAVVFPDEATARSIVGLNDSKQCTPSQRERLYEQIVGCGAHWAAASVEPDEIDRINILRAAMKAMAEAVRVLNPLPTAVLVDGNRVPDSLGVFASPLVKGDALSLSISAASILAKVTRDRIMLEYDALYPDYGFKSHKGYPSPEHRNAIVTYGILPIHRRTFRGVREVCEAADATFFRSR